ncbi:MAG: HDIG domain-containing protein [Desulfobulbales bacterium]|nr:HDIG domain-containing protein [Desulfobulbales bacterium]
MNATNAAIPGVKECLNLMEQYHMLPNIMEHSIVVARVAEVITNSLIRAGKNQLSLEKVIAGSLLHDIGKTACLNNDDDHAARGFEICLSHNLEPIADIVAEHVILKNFTPESGFTEKEIVYYADKRVNHNQVVSLEERLAYILERYGMNNKIRCLAIKKNYGLCRELEMRMFSLIAFEPHDIEEMLQKEHSVI